MRSHLRLWGPYRDLLVPDPLNGFEGRFATGNGHERGRGINRKEGRGRDVHPEKE